MNNRRRVWLIALLCALTVIGCAACTVFPDREKPASHIADFFKRVPGVAHVDPGYTNTMTNGAGYQVWVYVKAPVDAAALSRAARMFVEAVDGVGSPEHDVELWFVDDERSVDGSTAAFRLTDSWQKRNRLTANEVAAAAQLWANVHDFPGVARAGATMPTDQDATGRGGDVGATVRDRAAGMALQQRYPELTGHWTIATGDRS